MLRRVGGERGTLHGAGQRAVDHQMPHVLEAAGLREIDGGVLAIVMEALPAPDVTQGGVGDDDTRQTSRHMHKGGCGRVDRHVFLLQLDPTVHA